MKKLLVALDGSPRARGVLRAAVDLARRLDADLVLLRAAGIPGELPIEAYASDPDAVARLLEQRAREDLAALAADVGPSRVRIAAVRVEQGSAWQLIDRIAREEDADVIVIGAHGYGAVERLLGTTAAKVVNHADRAVLVVREPSPPA